METSIQEAFKVLRANVISEVLQLLDKFQDKSELVSNEIRTLSAELNSVWTRHLASKSPLPLSPSRDQVIVSQNQEVTQPGPKPINTSIDEETSQRDVSNDTALQREPLNREPHDREISPEAIPLPPPSNEASCRSPSSPDPLNTQHLLQDNASHDTDVNKENPGTGSHASEQHSSHGNNSIESVVEHRRDKRTVEETEIGQREEEEEEEKEGAEGDEQEVEEGEDCEEDEINDKHDNEPNEEPQTKLSGPITKKGTNRSMLGKGNEHNMTSKGQKAISSAKPSSARGKDPSLQFNGR